jgi:hypothetical protein
MKLSQNIQLSFHDLREKISFFLSSLDFGSKIWTNRVHRILIEGNLHRQVTVRLDYTNHWSYVPFGYPHLSIFLISEKTPCPLMSYWSCNPSAMAQDDAKESVSHREFGFQYPDLAKPLGCILPILWERKRMIYFITFLSVKKRITSLWISLQFSFYM